MKISATNPSTREIHLLPSAWIAHGSRITAGERDETNLAKAIANALRALQDSDAIHTVQRHAEYEKRSMVAAGLLFVDELLKPNETIARTIIFYVPTDEYDLIAVSATMPSAEDVSRTELEWVFDKETEDLKPVLYRVNDNGRRTPIKESDADSDKRLRRAWPTANSEISLWP